MVVVGVVMAVVSVIAGCYWLMQKKMRKLGLVFVFVCVNCEVRVILIGMDRW